MRQISISDCTVRHSDERAGEKLSFRLKIEIAKILDNLGVSLIELDTVRDLRTDHLLVKSVASAVKSAAVSVPVDILDPESPSHSWDAVREAAHPRLQVPVPVSAVQMEYFCHTKQSAMPGIISRNVAACAALCPDVEFIAGDFTRSEPAFLRQAIEAAVSAGATTVTVCDSAGDLLPDEFKALISGIREILPEGVKLGVKCCNTLHLADACAIAAVQAGADEIKTSVFGRTTTSLGRFSTVFGSRSQAIGATIPINLTGINHSTDRIRRMCESYRSKSHVSNGLEDAAKYEEVQLTGQDGMSEVLKAVSRLGYDLQEEDGAKVFEAFSKAARNGSTIGAKELDSIVAAVAFQVPPTYRLGSFVINSGNVISATCHIQLKRDEETLESACIGDGPIDAAFKAIDNVLGRHYELDDFQIKSVTEGREAMGDAVVRLRHQGKVYSGRGVSTDIIGSSIMAYLNAVNKIAYEEAQA